MKNLDQQIQNFLIYLGNKGCSPSTQRTYRFRLIYFSSWLRGKPISIETINYFRFHLSSKGISKSTQNYYLVALRSFFNFIDKEGLPIISRDKIELSKVPEREISYLTSTQVKQILNEIRIVKINKKKTFTRIRDKTILELLFSTGLRVSELCSLDQEEIDLKRGEFAIVGKGGKARLIFLSDEAKYWLRKYLRLRRDGYSPLFIYSTQGKLRGRRMELQAIESMVRKYALKAKIPMRVTPHMFRHAYACDLLRNGANLRLVQELLGHKNIATTQIYTHITNLELKEGYRKYHSGNFNTQ